MSLGKSTWEESIPSIHDGVLVDCRIHQPSPKHGNDANTVAVFAHPYAPLGGCMDDPVVEAVASQLLGQGVLVGLFNFRCVLCSERGFHASLVETDRIQRICVYETRYARLSGKRNSCKTRTRSSVAMN